MCPIKYILKYDCPTCGVTRALVCLIRFDFIGYAKYNVMALFLFIAVILVINKEVFIHKRYVDYYIYIVVVVNFAYYIVRLSFLNNV